MADSSRSTDYREHKARTPSKSKVVHSQKISLPSPTAEGPEEEAEARDRAPPIRSHTPGHLSSKSHSSGHHGHDRRRKASESSIRQRSQSVVSKSSSSAPPPAPTPTPKPPASRPNGDLPLRSADPTEPPAGSSSNEGGRRPLGLRSTSAIAGGKTPTSAAGTPPPRKPTQATRPRGPYTKEPPLQDPRTAPDVPAAPSSGMYWSRAPVSGAPHTPLRAHTTTIVGSNVFVFGGCDSRSCFNELYVLDADGWHWSSPQVIGECPVPLRAMTCTAVGKKLVVFGGGDGPAYYNDVYVLDTVSFRWHRPRIAGGSERIPSARRAHTACLYKNGIYVFGGGDGVRALNDVWRLDVSDLNKMSWKLISPATDGRSPPPGGKGSGDGRPKARGYHTANMVGSKLIIFGGSDGGECFNDVWVYDVEAYTWRNVSIPVTYRRLSHTATIVGSYLFVIGGHDGNEYQSDVLLLNLVTMTWDRRRVYGMPPSGRGYHGVVLHDSRLIMIGGFDGSEVFGDVWSLELAVHAYYSQISHFTIEV